TSRTRRSDSHRTAVGWCESRKTREDPIREELSPCRNRPRRCTSAFAAARFEALSQAYAWQQVSKSSRFPATALAVVRDGSAWYALTPVQPDATGAYRILVFHFCRTFERFGLRRVARWNREEGGGNWRHGRVRLRCPSDARSVANLTRSVRLLGMSLGPGP